MLMNGSCLLIVRGSMFAQANLLLIARAELESNMLVIYNRQYFC